MIMYDATEGEYSIIQRLSQQFPYLIAQAPDPERPVLTGTADGVCRMRQASSCASKYTGNVNCVNGQVRIYNYEAVGFDTHTLTSNMCLRCRVYSSTSTTVKQALE